MAKLLIVDDEPAMCELVTTILSAAGYDTTAIVHSADAVKRIEDGEHFDLAVLDVMMPGMTGDELARRLRLRDPDVKVLFVTGFSEALFTARPLLWGGESFLEKPFTPAGLCEAVSLSLYGTTERR